MTYGQPRSTNLFTASPGRTLGVDVYWLGPFDMSGHARVNLIACLKPASGSEAEPLVSWQDLSATVLWETLTQFSQDMEELYTLLLVPPL